ncbi:MAG: Dph6-related ATP pyrophosphatase, partial [Candidatus Syntropharchaeia archaeon]
MKVASLLSGGKDSLYALYVVLQHGWDVKYFVSLIPERQDSWMFHSANIHLV